MLVKSHFLMGRVGAGKQTQIDVWLQFLQSQGLCGVQVSTGNIIAANIEKNTSAGQMARPFYNSGNLVPDEITFMMLREYFASLAHATDYIFDGIPRDPEQYKKLCQFLQEINAPLASVVLLDISDEDSMDRLTTGRLVCPKGHSYHVVYNPPEEAGICHCGEVLKPRVDDVRAKIETRLAIYRNQTMPIFDMLSVPVITVDARALPSMVSAAFLKQLSAQA